MFNVHIKTNNSLLLQSLSATLINGAGVWDLNFCRKTSLAWSPGLKKMVEVVMRNILSALCIVPLFNQLKVRPANPKFLLIYFYKTLHLVMLVHMKKEK